MINFMGTDGFTWFQGKVESNQDPENIGRCKVRCIGFYSDKIKTADLPWAHPVTPLNTRGLFATPNVGDWVFGFFRDGEGASEPMMLGILPGRNTVNKAKAYTHDDQANQLITNSGHKIDLNDGTGEVTITHNNNSSQVTIHEDGKLTIKSEDTNINEPLNEILKVLNNVIDGTLNWQGNMSAPLIYKKQVDDTMALMDAEEKFKKLFKDF